MDQHKRSFLRHRPKVVEVTNKLAACAEALEMTAQSIQRCHDEFILEDIVLTAFAWHYVSSMLIQEFIELVWEMYGEDKRYNLKFNLTIVFNARTIADL